MWLGVYNAFRSASERPSRGGNPPGSLNVYPGSRGLFFGGVVPRVPSRVGPQAPPPLRIAAWEVRAEAPTSLATTIFASNVSIGSHYDPSTDDSDDERNFASEVSIGPPSVLGDDSDNVPSYASAIPHGGYTSAEEDDDHSTIFSSERSIGPYCALAEQVATWLHMQQAGRPSPPSYEESVYGSSEEEDAGSECPSTVFGSEGSIGSRPSAEEATRLVSGLEWGHERYHH